MIRYCLLGIGALWCGTVVTETTGLRDWPGTAIFWTVTIGLLLVCGWEQRRARHD